MDFAQNLKELRKKAGFSQEELANRLNVSRQAITKWETDLGMPDVDNLTNIADLFGISLDELIRPGVQTGVKSDFLFESVTQYDASKKIDYDINVGGAKEVSVDVVEGEKITIRLASNTLNALGSSFKVKVDEHDIDVCRLNKVTEEQTRESLYVFISLPLSFLSHTELAANTDVLTIHNFNDETLEFDGKANEVYIVKSNGNIELTSTNDLNVIYDSFNGRLEINQMSSLTKVNVPNDSNYSIKKKGRSNSMLVQNDGVVIEKKFEKSSPNMIELKGFHSELIINEYSSLSKEQDERINSRGN